MILDEKKSMLIDQLDNMSFEQIRDSYTEYLKAQQLSPLTIQTSRSDAFYLLRHDDTVDFWKLIRSDNFETRALAHLQSVLSKRSNGNVPTNTNAYMSHLRRLRNFLYSSGDKAIVTRTKSPQTVVFKKTTKIRLDVPTPTAVTVAAYQRFWDALDDYRNQERALNRLFFKLTPENKEITDILLIATVLNSFLNGDH